jgi:hypothetical protein
MEPSSLERFQIALPPFLSETDKRALLAQLEGFPGSGSFFGITDDPEPVQGDAWSGFVALQYPDGKSERVAGLVISNSCDIGAANKPDPDQRILFAPLIDVAAYEHLLKELGRPADAIDERLKKIRNQEIHRIFYIPENGAFGGESLVLLDDLHAQPLSSLNGIERVFSLSTYGWYVLLMKLSVHFTRTTDGVTRRSL